MDVSWGALALTLTAVGGVLTWMAWRRRGLAAGIRGVAWTLVPLAAWLTGILELVADMAGDVSSWALALVFSPVVWTGIILAGLSAVLFVVSGFLKRRRGSVSKESTRVGSSPPQPAAVQRAPQRDDIEGMDEIEAILKKHGI